MNAEGQSWPWETCWNLNWKVWTGNSVVLGDGRASQRAWVEQRREAVRTQILCADPALGGGLGSQGRLEEGGFLNMYCWVVEKCGQFHFSYSFPLCYKDIHVLSYDIWQVRGTRNTEDTGGMMLFLTGLAKLVEQGKIDTKAKKCIQCVHATIAMREVRVGFCHRASEGTGDKLGGQWRRGTESPAKCRPRGRASQTRQKQMLRPGGGNRPNTL